LIVLFVDLFMHLFVYALVYLFVFNDNTSLEIPEILEIPENLETWGCKRGQEMSGNCPLSIQC